jgi:hypothetical protein
MGRGLGASGAFSSLVAAGADAIAPAHARANGFYTEYLGDGSKNPLMDWLVFEVIGVFVGGFLSGTLAGRVRKTIDRGPSATTRMRPIYAFAGRPMGIGQVCPWMYVRQALTGGALLNVGSWAFGVRLRRCLCRRTVRDNVNERNPSINSDSSATTSA